MCNLFGVMPDRYEPYRQQVKFLLQEITSLSQRKREIELEMEKIEQLFHGNLGVIPAAERVNFLQGLEQVMPAGLTDRVRLAFKNAYPKGLTPIQLRDALLASGVSLSQYSNAMATVHTVIRRLLASREIEPNGDVDMGGYRWIVKAPRPPSWKISERK